MNSEKPRQFLFYLINGLTIFRLILAPIILILIFSGARLQAFILFLIAVLTDLLDGDLARRFNLTSKTGETLDGLADFALIYGAIIPLFILNEFPLLIKIAVVVATILFLAGVIEHTIRNKTLILPKRRPGMTVNSYFVYTTLIFFIINSPYKHLIAYLTCFIMAITAFDYLASKKK